MKNTRDVVDKIFEIGKRRGFFWQSYEIYGGIAGFYDLGPYGKLLKNNIINEWRNHFIQRYQEMIVEIETPIIGPEKVYKASGHVESFTDPIVECTSCKRLFRADHLIEEKINTKIEGASPEKLTTLIKQHKIKCPVCGGELGEVKLFNLLFQTQIGPYTGSIGYIRPEAAQGMFLAFKRVYQAMRNKLPLGIAQIGRVGRNEISPRQGMIRLREFTIMEFEFFFDPKKPMSEDYLARIEDKKIRILPNSYRVKGIEKPEEYKIREAIDEKIIINPWLAYWMYESQAFIEKIGVPYTQQFFEEKLPEERAHYSSQTFDQLVKTERWGWVEVSGHAYRGDYDLKRHMEYSGEDLRVFRELDKPIEKTERKLVINKAVLGKTFKEKTPLIEKTLKNTDMSKLENLLKTKEDFIELNGYRIPKEAISIIVKKEKITGEKFIPHVVEPSFGSDRLVYVTLEYAYRVKNDRVILSIPPILAPVKVAVFPLLSDEKQKEIAKEIYLEIKEEGLTAIYDDTGSIGRRYARADELGVPLAITIDHETLSNNTVTMRDRDSWKQIRVHRNELLEKIKEFIYNGKDIDTLGKIF